MQCSKIRQLVSLHIYLTAYINCNICIVRLFGENAYFLLVAYMSGLWFDLNEDKDDFFKQV